MKKIVLLLSVLLTLVQLNAQKTYKYYIDITGGGGLHSVQFNPAQGGDHKVRAGGTLGVLLRKPFSERLSVGGGLEFISFAGKSEYDLLVDSVSFKDKENGQVYSFKTTFKNWTEIQRSINIEIPIGVYYRFPLKQKWTLVTGGGLKIDIPFSKKFVTKNDDSDGEMIRSGNFESTNVEYSDMPQHEFYNSENFKGKAEMKGAGLSLFCEIGANHPLNNNKSIYFGAYFCHSVMNSLKGTDGYLYNPEKADYCGIVSSDLVDKTHLLAAGLKVGISFGMAMKSLRSLLNY